MYNYFMGCDPGKSGAIAVFNRRGDLEETALMKDHQAMINCVWHYHRMGVAVWIEKVHAFPGQGVTSMFTFGEAYGWIQALVETVQTANELSTENNPFSWELIPPKKWQGQLSIPPRKKVGRKFTETSPQWKKRLVSEAKHRFGNVVVANNADAILIAECCRRTMK